MFGSVKTQPNHYETLGLTPAATADEIAKAFATRMRIRITSPEEADDHALKLFAAYETLRDPFSRRIYNAEIGLEPEPEPEPTAGRHLDLTSEQRVAPFIAAALRDPVEPTDQANPPNFILLPDSEDPQSTVEQSEEPLIAGTGLPEPPMSDSVVPVAPEHRSEWNRAGAGTGAVVVGLGVTALLIGLLWGNGDRPPIDLPGPTSVSPLRTAPRPVQVTQGLPQAAIPMEAAPLPLPESAATADAPVTLGEIDLSTNSSSAVSSAPPAATTNEPAATEIAERSGSGTIASSPDAQPAAPPATAGSPATNADSADPLAPAPPAVSQSAPTAVAQAANPTPVVRPTAVVNRAAPARWKSGGLVKADNPRGRYRGAVTVRFTVQPNGQVSGCRTAVSSGNAALDARTCRLIEQRVRFSPALDWQGRAIPSETRATYTWGVKHRPLLKQLLNLVRG